MAYSKQELLAAAVEGDLRRVKSNCEKLQQHVHAEHHGHGQSWDYLALREVEKDDMDEALKAASRAGRLAVVKYLSERARKAAVANALLNFCKSPQVSTANKNELYFHLANFKENRLSGQTMEIALGMITSSYQPRVVTKNPDPEPRKSSFETNTRFFQKSLPRSGKSCFSQKQLQDLYTRRAALQRGLEKEQKVDPNSFWAYFTNVPLKKSKIEGIDELINYSYEKGMTIFSAIKKADKLQPQLRTGWFSQTNALMNELLNSSDEDTCCYFP